MGEAKNIMIASLCQKVKRSDKNDARRNPSNMRRNSPPAASHHETTHCCKELNTPLRLRYCLERGSLRLISVISREVGWGVHWVLVQQCTAGYTHTLLVV